MQQVTQQMYNELLQDMKLTKDTIVKIAVELGAYDSNGNKNEKFNIQSLVKLVMGAVTNPSALKEKFHFVNEVYPLLQKYKNL